MGRKLFLWLLFVALATPKKSYGGNDLFCLLGKDIIN
jgi:hypothetical protein